MKFVLRQPGVREVRVKLMLGGGHAATLVLPPEHPLLAQLLETVAGAADGDGGAAPRLFQIPVEGGRASLTFASHQLVGVVTDPAVVVQPDAIDAPTTSQLAAVAGSATDRPEPAASAPRIIRHAVVQLDQFLTVEECDWLRQTVISAESRFRPSWTSDDSIKDYRKSLVLDVPEPIVRLVVGKIRTVMSDVIAQLKMPVFTVGRIECQVTASTDGCYFRVHTDSGNVAGGTTRKLTYVYYFNREPKAFTGGELRVYDDEFRNGNFARTDTYQVIEPRHNSIIFFNAAVMHEVMPVHVPSTEFRDSRFTVNGWVHRTDPTPPTIGVERTGER